MMKLLGCFSYLALQEFHTFTNQQQLIIATAVTRSHGSQPQKILFIFTAALVQSGIGFQRRRRDVSTTAQIHTG